MAVLITRAFAALLLALAGVSSCFSPRQPPCAFSCVGDGLCPSGYSCLGDGVCHRDDGQGTCDIPPQNDAGGGGDAAGDAGSGADAAGDGG